MSNLIIISRPISATAPPYLLMAKDGQLTNYTLDPGRLVGFSIDTSTKYCTGWYDIDTHTNHLCERSTAVDKAYDSCYVCRQKTEFNPAFYNTSDISSKQAKYNEAPHTVYVAYFGNDLAKTGIMSDSRGTERLYEQGALFYAIIARCPNATQAHNIENRLIQKGLRNSVTKKQKADVFLSQVDTGTEQAKFRAQLEGAGHKNIATVCLLDTFFFGSYPKLPIHNFGDHPVSGKVVGVVGRYVVMENNQRLYGFWLNELFGYKITFRENISLIERQPEQASLF